MELYAFLKWRGLLEHPVYKEESLFVCLFFMHSVPVRARAAKLCMVHPWVQEKVKTGSAGARGGW